MTMVTEKKTLYYLEKERRIPVVREYDVVVVGGSQSGCAAAICAARQGASVLIVERDPFLGGQSLWVMMTWEKRAFVNNLGAVATRGIAKEMVERILEKGEIGLTSDPLWRDPPGCEEMRDGNERLDVEAIKHTLLEMCLEADVETLFDTMCVDVMLEEGDEQKLPRVNGIIVENKSGRRGIKAKIVVDASAYLDVVWFAIGEKGVIIRPPEERIDIGWSTWFGGIDTEGFVNYVLESKTARGYPSLGNPAKVLHHLKTGRMLQYGGFSEIVEKARELGYFDDWPVNLRQPRRLGASWKGSDIWAGGGGDFIKEPDALDAWDLSRAETQRQIMDDKVLRIWRLVPGWENAYIARTSARLGLRETRILKAVTMITTKDMFDPDHDRPDAIGRSAGHDPGKNNLWKAYPIPYGALVPKYLDGVLCCSRAIGVDSVVPLDAHRGITPTIVVGQAAGTAAALAASNNVEPRDVEIQELRKILRESDVVLDVETIKLDTIPEDRSKWQWKPHTKKDKKLQ